MGTDKRTGDNRTPATDTATEERTEIGSNPPLAQEIGGPSGPEPTRYGDWERRGRCIDF